MGEVIQLDERRPPPRLAHLALISALERVPTVTWLCSTTALADFILLCLWSSGFRIVLRDEDDGA